MTIPEPAAILRYTGHCFYDVGVAAITAYVNKRHPHEVTDADLDQVATYIEQNYFRAPLRGHLTMAFTSNAWFIQDAFNPDKPDIAPEKRSERLAKRNQRAAGHVRQWQDENSLATDDLCVFTHQPIIRTALSDRLRSGYAGRAQIPLLQGDEDINFYTNGGSGLPISGIALLALQFFPMGCAKSGTGLLAVHSDNEQLTYALTNEFLQENLHNITQAQAAGEDKLPGASRSLRTLLIEKLLAAEARRQRADQAQLPASITAYNFNNGKSPSLAIYHLPLEVVGFLQVAHSADYRDSWQQVVQRAWERIDSKQGSRKKGGGPLPEPRRNYLYEDLFTLLDTPQHLARFIRIYFLRMPGRGSVEGDPRRNYSLQRENQLVSWSLLSLFLRKVVHMDPERIQQIANLGDGLAQYVRRQGGKRFFRSFFTEQRAEPFRGLLIKANLAHVHAGNAPLFDMYSYIGIFEEGEEVMRRDWRLARDLVLMRMIDQLRDWLSQNTDAIPDESDDGDNVSAA